MAQGEPPATAAAMPPWINRLIITIILWTALALLAYSALRELRGLVSNLVIALFLSFALEPAVNWLHKHGWRRGLATGAVLFSLFVTGLILIGLMIPILVKEIGQFIQAVPGWLDRLSRFTKKCCNADISTAHLTQQLQGAKSDVTKFAANIAGNLLGFGVKVLSAVFNLLTIGLFTFYFVTDGPRIRRSVCSLLPPQRQREVLWAWETAIDKTGGYFYSRLLLAIINGSLMFVVLLVLGVPFALPLAVFEGLVAEFIPIVGTYVAGAAPILVALADKPINALILFIYITIYQQIENAVLSPRLSAKTMELNAGIAFGAAIAGGSIGGIVGAFLALPAAAVIQAFAGNYIKRYEVMDSALTTIDAPPPPRAPRSTLWSRYQARRKRTATPSETGG
jgi:predicted PurR-regulated permease PerM